MITATVKYNDNYTDIEFPCSEAYLSAKLMEIHVDDMVAHVGELENRLAEAVEELRTMRQELLQVQNRSLKAVLQRSCKALEQNI